MPKIVTDFEKQSRKRQNFRAARALSDISIIRAALSDISVTTIEKTFFASEIFLKSKIAAKRRIFC